MINFSPVAVTGAHAFTTLTAGPYYTCGVDTVDDAWCWGHDAQGQIGDGDTTGADKFSPVVVAGAHSFTALAAGGAHACGLDVAGEAWCWGDNSVGALGGGSGAGTVEYAPVRVLGAHTFRN